MKLTITNSKIHAQHAAVSVPFGTEVSINSSELTAVVRAIEVRDTNALKSSLGIPPEVSEELVRDALKKLIEFNGASDQTKRSELERTPLWRNLLNISADVAQIAGTFIAAASHPMIIEMM
jgi:hypothetical protein